jgi:hypothetical protein
MNAPKLINLSNHPSDDWSVEQKALWAEIIDIGFPDIDPTATADDIFELATQYASRVKVEIAEDMDTPFYLHLAGEYTFCYLLSAQLINVIPLAVACTARMKTEEITPTGVVKSTTQFKFVQWRII